MEQHKQLIHSVWDISPFGICVKDADKDFRIILCNKKFADIVGRTEEEIIGHTDSELNYTCFSPDVCLAQDKEALKSNSLVSAVENTAGNGSKRFFSISKLPLITNNGKHFVVGIFADITKDKSLEDKLNRLLIQAKEQHEFLQTLIDTLPVQIFVKNANDNFKYIYSNNERNKFFGVNGSDFEGKTDFEVHAGDVPSEIRMRDLKAAESGEPIVFDISVKNASGEMRRIKTIKRLYSSANGDRLLIGASTDITDTARLISDERLLREIMGVFMGSDDFESTISMFLKILMGRFQADDCWLMRCESEKSEMPLIIDTHSAGTKSIREYLEKLGKNYTDKSWFNDLRRNHKVYAYDIDSNSEYYGIWKPFLSEAGMKSLYSSGIFSCGKMIGTVGMSFSKKPRVFSERDERFLDAIEKMTEAVIMRQFSRGQLVEALRKSRDAEKAKSFFIASVSHEIRTPLNALLGFTELLHDESLSENLRKEYLENISYSGRALLKLINDVLDLSKLESEKMEFTLDVCDLTELVGDVCGVFGAKLKLKGLRININAKDIPLLYIDKSRVRQILFNFIGNAVKFTEKGSITVCVAFTLDAEKSGAGTLKVLVADTGRGISEVDQRKLFEPFVQLTNLRGRNATNEGTGLGLAISRRMIEHMGGKVIIESKEGEGSVFGFEIGGVEFKNRILKPLEPIANKPETTPQNLSKLRVLIVDDVPMNLKVLEALLKKFSISCVCASSGAEALNMLERADFDYVLTDLWMPDMNGAELAEKIRQKFGEKINIFAVTADVVSGQNFEVSVFNDIITKPISSEKLLEVFSK